MSKHTTIRLSEDLLHRAKLKAAAEGRTLTSLIEEGLRDVIARPPATPRSQPVLPRVSRAGGGFAEGFQFLNSPKLATLVQEIEDEDNVARVVKSSR
ncbi:MAG: hypothetical protein KGM42_05725 [Hyphomicrobiales bacterium]|nr:hypothetical protein [Hyphomicrobiales bacterium]